jgi:hypothetical protein
MISEALKAAQRRYRDKPDVKEKRREYDRRRNRAEYMREYRRRKKEESIQADDTATT